MPTIQSPRGTRDILPSEQAVWNFVRTAAERVAAQMNFQRITTPTYEERELFQRSIGGGTDVIDKELFLVRGIASDEEQYALRPEGTAGIVRAFIEHGMHTWPQPVKLWSFVSCFRYDRPQKGRYREHYQFDIEYFGEVSAFADAWVILSMWQFYKQLGISDNLELRINTLGTSEERTRFSEGLRNYLEARRYELTTDSQKRIEINPLRVLDSKDAEDRKVIEGSPTLFETLSEESKAHFREVVRLLKSWFVPVIHDPYLVRGLDYYSHTTFEWVPVKKGVGQQASVGGGGRYDGLVPQLGGPSVGAVGAGIGLDRICELVLESGVEIPSVETPEYFLVAADDTGRRYIESTLLPKLLTEGRRVDAALARDGVGNQLKQASKTGAAKAIIVGEQEVASGQVVVKDLASGEQTSESF